MKRTNLIDSENEKSFHRIKDIWAAYFILSFSPGTLKSLLQHHCSKASILRCSAFFIVQLSHPYMTTGKTIALTRRTFVDKVMSLPFNMLSRLVRMAKIRNSWITLNSCDWTQLLVLRSSGFTFWEFFEVLPLNCYLPLDMLTQYGDTWFSSYS